MLEELTALELVPALAALELPVIVIVPAGVALALVGVVALLVRRRRR